MPATAVSYQLLIRLGRNRRLTVGRLGAFRLAAGWFVYTGSARRNMRARVERHLCCNKRLRWHVDWLLALREARVVNVRFSSQSECALNARTRGDVPIPGFGASDCRARCGSHLRYLGPLADADPVPSWALGEAPGQQVAV